MLENIYAIFRVTPYHTNIARSLLKEPKFYFYDIARVSNEGARLENLVAAGLLKRIQFLEDVYGVKGNLHYLRTKDGIEIDFLVFMEGRPVLCIEVKTSEETPSKSFSYFRKFMREVKCIQLVLNLKREYDTPDGIHVRHLLSYMAKISSDLSYPLL